ncbi:hypothetical protein GCM10010341_86510 [Streptomyces noursei]|nr:hypothetical protein GCM10010341_86510 [Streptomyces noursei]
MRHLAGRFAKFRVPALHHVAVESVAAALASTVLDLNVPLPRSQGEVDARSADLRWRLPHLARKAGTQARARGQHKLLAQASAFSSQPAPAGYMPSRIHLIRLAEVAQALLAVHGRDPGGEALGQARATACPGPSRSDRVLPERAIGNSETTRAWAPSRLGQQLDLQLVPALAPVPDLRLRRPTSAVRTTRGPLHDAGPPS